MPETLHKQPAVDKKNCIHSIAAPFPEGKDVWRMLVGLFLSLAHVRVGRPEHVS